MYALIYFAVSLFLSSAWLPLLATWIKADDAPGLSFKQRKGRLAWAFNAVSNEGLIAGI